MHTEKYNRCNKSIFPNLNPKSSKIDNPALDKKGLSARQGQTGSWPLGLLRENSQPSELDKSDTCSRECNGEKAQNFFPYSFQSYISF